MERLKKVGDVKARNSSEIKNSPIGLGFEKLDRGLFDPEKAYDKVAKLGVKWIRIQSGWARTEKVPGVYEWEWLDSIIDNLIRRSLKPWVCLCYGNALYTPAAGEVFGAVGCPPIATETERNAWHRYVAALTRRYAGRVELFEVWNEPDGVWCWKHGPDGGEYGEFVKATAAAIREGNPAAKVVAGAVCMRDLGYLNDMLATGAGKAMDYLSYHGYWPDELEKADRVRAYRALCARYNPAIRVIQGETGVQSRSDGAGALREGAWTPRKQAKFLARHIIADLFEEVSFASYFSCMDMIEALNGMVRDKASYLDYGYFGVLSAEFDENGIATGEYAPKLSYRTLQVIASIFREDFSLAELPVQFMPPGRSMRVMRNDDYGPTVVLRGFRKGNGSAAAVYWKPSEILTTAYESTISLEAAELPREIRLVDILDGSIYELPPQMREDNGRGRILFHHLPLKDSPLLLTFGDFL